jgi:quinol monooxygenase YgiN
MIIVSGRLYVKAGMRETFLAGSREAMVAARRAEGCHDFVVAADPLEDDRVNVYEAWDSDETLEAFRGSGMSDDLSSLIERAQVRRHVIAATGAA